MAADELAEAILDAYLRGRWNFDSPSGEKWEEGIADWIRGEGRAVVARALANSRFAIDVLKAAGYRVYTEGDGDEIAHVEWAGAMAYGVDDDHRVVSTDGFRCDICGGKVNGQTDEDGYPLNEGDAVGHVGGPS